VYSKKTRNNNYNNYHANNVENTHCFYSSCSNQRAAKQRQSIRTNAVDRHLEFLRLQRVLEITKSILDLAFDLVGLAVRLYLGIAYRLADGLLD
jgi:hypothetical protein